MSGNLDVDDGNSSNPNILAIDLGSSSFRAAVVDTAGQIVSSARKPPAPYSPADAGELALEYDSDETWQLVVNVAKAALSNSNQSSSSIAAISVTSQRQGTVLFDGDFGVLYAGPNNDMRGVFAGAALDEEFGDLIWESCGHLPAFLLAWARLKWFQEEEPARFSSAAYVATLADWIVYRLTGELAVGLTSGVEAGLLDVRSGDPAISISEALGIDGISIPRVVTSGEAAGYLHASLADSLGLRTGIPVVNAGADTQAGLVGLGVSAPGATGVVAGWSCAVQMVSSEPIFDSDHGLWTGRHALDDRWVLECNAGIMGGAYAWLAGLIGSSGDSAQVFERLNALANDANPGAGNLTSHLGPDSLNMSTPGLSTGGIVFPVPLALAPPLPGEVARASFEGFAFTIRASLEQIASVSGENSKTISIGGGMTRSSTFNEIIAAVLDEEITIGPPDTTLIGAAKLATDQIGEDPSGRSGLDTKIRPESSLVRDYSDLYKHWTERSRILSQLPV